MGLGEGVQGEIYVEWLVCEQQIFCTILPGHSKTCHRLMWEIRMGDKERARVPGA